MYEICNIIYGHVLTKDDFPKLAKAIKEKWDEEVHDDEVMDWLDGAEYITHLYSGMGFHPASYIGVKLGSITCMDHGKKLEDCYKQPDPDEIYQCELKFRQLKDDLGMVLICKGIQICWSTS